MTNPCNIYKQSIFISWDGNKDFNLSKDLKALENNKMFNHTLATISLNFYGLFKKMPCLHKINSDFYLLIHLIFFNGKKIDLRKGD